MNGQNDNTQNLGLVNLEYVASSVRLRLNKDNRWHEKILQLVIDGYSELKLNDTIRNIKTAIITVNDANIADFPRDYVDYVAIGVAFGGRTYPLVMNRNIILPTEESCGEFSRVTETYTNEQFDDRTSNWFDMPSLPSYTVGGAFSDAYYRIDHEGGRIVFLTAGFKGLTIIMEYKSLGISDETIIPRDAVPALRSYVKWVLNDSDRSLSETRIEVSRREWIRERDKLYAMNHSFTANEFLDLMKSHTHRGIK